MTYYEKYFLYYLGKKIITLSTHQQSHKHQEMKREAIPISCWPNWGESQEWQSYGRGWTTQLAEVPEGNVCRFGNTTSAQW